MAGIDLRAYVFLDSLQAQYAAFLGTVAQGFLPLPGDASLYIEVSPGIEINRLTDIALKSTSVKPGMQIIERFFGLLEIHSPSQAEVRAAGAAILGELGLEESARIKPQDPVQPDHPPDRRPPGAADQPHAPRPDDHRRPDALRAGDGAGGLRAAGRQRGREGRQHQHPRGPVVRLHGPRVPGRRGGGHRRRPGARPWPRSRASTGATRRRNETPTTKRPGGRPAGRNRHRTERVRWQTHWA